MTKYSYKLSGAYVYFCDDNNLKRYDIHPEEHLRNLDKMATAILKKREYYQNLMIPVCPHCGKPE
jgi:hypothetical protein